MALLVPRKLSDDLLAANTGKLIEGGRLGVFLVFVSLLIIVSLWKSCDEVEYALRSKEASATIISIRVRLNSKKRGENRPTDVRYSYFDEFAGAERTQTMTMSHEASKKYRVGDVFQIEYLKRKMVTARKVGSPRWVWPFILVATIGVSGYILLCRPERH